MHKLSDMQLFMLNCNCHLYVTKNEVIPKGVVLGARYFKQNNVKIVSEKLINNTD